MKSLCFSMISISWWYYVLIREQIALTLKRKKIFTTELYFMMIMMSFVSDRYLKSWFLTRRIVCIFHVVMMYISFPYFLTRFLHIVNRYLHSSYWLMTVTSTRNEKYSKGFWSKWEHMQNTQCEYRCKMDVKSIPWQKITNTQRHTNNEEEFNSTWHIDLERRINNNTWCRVIFDTTRLTLTHPTSFDVVRHRHDTTRTGHDTKLQNTHRYNAKSNAYW